MSQFGINANVLPTMAYGSEIWNTMIQELSEPSSMQHNMYRLRVVLGCMTEYQIYCKNEAEGQYINTLQVYKMMSVAHRALYTEERIRLPQDAKRPQGRPLLRWTDSMVKTVKQCRRPKRKPFPEL